MGNLIFSLNIVMPVFIIIIFGFILRIKNIISADFISTATTIVYYFALPASLFIDVSESDFYSLMNIKFVIFIVGATVAFFIIAWIFAVIFIKDKSKISAFVQGTFRGNYVYVGLPITQNILQTNIIPSAILVIAFVLPVYNILAVLVLSYYNSNKGKVGIKDLVFSIMKNPMIVAIVLALPFSLLKIKLPFIITKPLDYLGVLATPLALMLVGASIRFDALVRNLKYIINAAVLKVIIQPLIIVPFALIMGFNSEEIATILVLFTTPTALNAYIMAKKLGGDGELSAGIIVLTVILTVITIPAGTFVLKSLGYI